MLTVEALKAFGANTDEGVQRCFGKADFYLRLVKTVPAEPSFDKLREAVEAGDLNAGFEYAHALKGVAGNLSLTPIYTPVSEITELLRARTETDYAPLVAEIIAKRDELAAIIASE